MRLNPKAQQEILAHSRREYPHEACGLLIGDGDTVVEAYPAQNLKAGERNDRFVINPDHHFEADKKARQMGLDIIGCYHSHPDWPARPSKTDLEDSWPGYYYIIVSVPKGEPDKIRAWKLDDTEKAFEQVPLDIE